MTRHYKVMRLRRGSAMTKNGGWTEHLPLHHLFTACKAGRSEETLMSCIKDFSDTGDLRMTARVGGCVRNDKGR